jgi:hypothetical protein
MPVYDIRWELPQIDADSPEEAARIARDIQLDPYNLATWFEVCESGERNGTMVELPEPSEDAEPTMLAALEEIASTPKHGEPCEDAPGGIQTWGEDSGQRAIDRLHAIVDQARAAIAKAKGSK